MNNDKPSLDLEFQNIPIFYYSNQLLYIVKILHQQKKKVSGPNPSNHEYIHYSDIKIR
jgi:hypothetical protein